MGKRLKVDTTELRTTGSALMLLSYELKHAERITHDYSRALGHADLARRLDEMQGKWDDRRNDLVAEIEGLGELAEKAGVTFEDVDAELARVARGG